MKKRFSSYILFITVGVLAVSSVVMTIESATSSLEMSKLEKTEIELLKYKRDLEESLVTSMSLSELQEQSVALGFAKAEELVYITQTESVATIPN